jgi:hypothetical protein
MNKGPLLSDSAQAGIRESTPSSQRPGLPDFVRRNKIPGGFIDRATRIMVGSQCFRPAFL